MTYIRNTLNYALSQIMKLEEFQLLNDKDKEIAVWNNGVFLKNFNDGTYVCDVYKLFEFYIAFYYELHKPKRAKITAAVCQEALPYVRISYHDDQNIQEV